MSIDEEILINKYGQSLISLNEIETVFHNNNTVEKRNLLTDLVYFVIQSKVTDEDILPAIKSSGLKETYTPCVLLKKGTKYNNLQRIVDLPEKEFPKSFKLLLELYKIAYVRRFKSEEDNPHKWWYWDLSDEVVVKTIKEAHR